jgi:DNA-binding beta-propeller fold protein YncE/plastocyanin
MRIPRLEGGALGLSRGRDALLLASLLAFGVIGWEHAYHSVVLGIGDESAAGHLVHVVRDGLLAFPVALVAVVGGLWLGRRLGLLARAGFVSVGFGLLLVPSVRVHSATDNTLSGGPGASHHNHAAAGGLEAATGVGDLLLHGLRDAAIAQLAALPLMLLGLVLVGGAVSGWRPRGRSRALVAASAVLLVLAFVGTGFASDSAGTASGAANVHTFQLTDNPGNWFDSGADIAGTRSLVVVAPGDTVSFTVAPPLSQELHTATSLLWPEGAPNMPLTQPKAFRGTVQVQLTTPGLYVFLCKLHPFMLGAAIVDDPATPELDLGKKVTLSSGPTIPTASDLALRLVRAFFVITNPANYRKYSATSDTMWDPTYPPVPVLAGDQNGNPVPVPDLDAFLGSYFHEPVTLPKATSPSIKGVGEVWVDTEYERTAHKTKPGTATAVDTGTWKVTKKFAFPKLNFNNGHNMWASRDQSLVYNTEWFGNRLIAFDRKTGKLLSALKVGADPAHVMTRTDTDQVHTTLNGEDAVIEASPGASGIDRRIPLQHAGDPTTHPHAHWMSSDGKQMAVPNANSEDSTLINVPNGTITSKLHTGLLPIAAGMMPDSSKYYVSNYEQSTVTVIDMSPPQVIKTIDLQANYDPISGQTTGPIGGFPVQTPVSPNGKYVIEPNTLTGTITIIDTDTDTLIKSLPCDPGCHGVNFGAKKGGGYLAYVSSKFSNSLIVVDPDPNNDGEATDATIVGRVVLNATDGTQGDDRVIANPGQGGQGVLPVPNVYNGWVQNLPASWKAMLSCQQRNPIEGNC